MPPVNSMGNRSKEDNKRKRSKPNAAARYAEAEASLREGARLARCEGLCGQWLPFANDIR